MCLLAAVAAPDVATADSGGVHWHVSVGVVSLIAIALIWLPSLLRYVFLAGGSIKAAGVEASTSGLIHTDRFLSELADLRTKVDTIGHAAPEAKQAIQQVNTAIGSMATQYVEADDAVSESTLDRVARQYENIRSTQPSGDARTREMDNLVNEVRLRATAAPSAAPQFAEPRLRSSRPGDRIVGIGLVEGASRAEQFDDVLKIFNDSQSAFEAYHSLRALDQLASLLTDNSVLTQSKPCVRRRRTPRASG